MMAIVLVIISILLISAGLFFVFLLRRKKKREVNNVVVDIKAMLDNQGYSSGTIVYVNHFLSLMLNKLANKFYIIRNYCPDLNVQLDVEEVMVQFIRDFELSKNTIILNYYKSGEIKTLTITPLNDEIKKFVHRIFHNSCERKITERLPQYGFSLFSASDYNCNYFWGYSPKSNFFCYLKLEDTIKKPINYVIKKYNLLKENFTIDVKYNYFETNIDGIAQQLLIYDYNFLSDLYLSLLGAIKEKYSLVCENIIYYNTYDNIVYLTNSTSSLLSIKLDEVDEVEYEANRIIFTLKDSERTVNYIANQEFITEFDDFVTGYNLRKIAHGFNYSTDKLINTTANTKFIVDFSRCRLVYCANINTFSRFSFLIYSFDDILNVKLERTSANIFVRIFLKDEQILDVSCTKYEVAEYIAALIRKIMDKNY